MRNQDKRCSRKNVIRMLMGIIISGYFGFAGSAVAGPLTPYIPAASVQTPAGGPTPSDIIPGHPPTSAQFMWYPQPAGCTVNCDNSGSPLDASFRFQFNLTGFQQSVILRVAADDYMALNVNGNFVPMYADNSRPNNTVPYYFLPDNYVSPGLPGFLYADITRFLIAQGPVVGPYLNTIDVYACDGYSAVPVGQACSAAQRSYRWVLIDGSMVDDFTGVTTSFNSGSGVWQAAGGAFFQSVPEPDSIALFAMSLLVLGAVTSIRQTRPLARGAGALGGHAA